MSDTPEWAATVKPGDTIVFGFRELDVEDAEDVRDQLRKRLEPLGINVLVIIGVDSITVARPEPEQDR